MIVEINKRPGFKGIMNDVRGIMLYLSGESIMPKWPLASPPRSLSTVCGFSSMMKNGR